MGNKSSLRNRIEECIQIAIANILSHGDTDIFPLTEDTVLLFSNTEGAVSKVLEIHDELMSGNYDAQPEVIRFLVPAGYLGQRLATQISPLWNAYYLAIVIACGSEIEFKRVTSDMVFSYRFISPTAEGQIFNPTIGWGQFIDATAGACAKYPYALATDISDFYHRIRISAISKLLSQTGIEDSLRKALIRVLELFEVDRYGLPVGGPASRLLAELVLTRIDESLLVQKVAFIRFVDDIRIFAKSEVDAHRHLFLLSNILCDEGFSLQKSKTQILRSIDLVEELNYSRAFALKSIEGVTANSDALMLIPQDPYSEMRAQINKQLSEFALHPDAVTTLIREFSKKRLNLSLARNLLASISHLPNEQAAEVFFALLDLSDTLTMIPIFNRLLEAIEKNINRLSQPSIEKIRDRLESLAFGQAVVVMFDFHRALCIRLLGRLPIGNVQFISLNIERLELVTQCQLIRREIVSFKKRYLIGDSLDSSLLIFEQTNSAEQ